jgi:hypothetical protein
MGKDTQPDSSVKQNLFYVCQLTFFGKIRRAEEVWAISTHDAALKWIRSNSDLFVPGYSSDFTHGADVIVADGKNRVLFSVEPKHVTSLTVAEAKASGSCLFYKKTNKKRFPDSEYAEVRGELNAAFYKPVILSASA